MLVRNWMQKDPITVSGDALVSETKRILIDNNLHALPVVDNGRLRGMVTRVHCLRAADHVAGTQDPNEFAFFVKRLKVKDIMVRNPATVSANDTMEHCLQKGQRLRIGQFPVIDESGPVARVVGMITANEIFKLSAQFLGSFESWSGVSLAPMRIQPGTLCCLAQIAERAGATLQALYPISKDDVPATSETEVKRVILRFTGAPTAQVAEAFREAGYPVLECSIEVQSKSA